MLIVLADRGGDVVWGQNKNFSHLKKRHLMDAFRINTTVTRFLKKKFKQVIFSIKSKYLNRNLSKKNP